MSMEPLLVTLLKLDCPRVFPDFAPVDTARPYVTYQHLGGRPLRWLKGDASDKRHSIVQVNVWSSKKSEALTLARAIEERLAAATVFNAKPEAEPVGQAEPDFEMYGTSQDFSIISFR
jgi:hypothetical protein